MNRSFFKKQLLGVVCVFFFCFVLFLTFVVLGIKPRALHTLARHSTPELYPSPVVWFFWFWLYFHCFFFGGHP